MPTTSATARAESRQQVYVGFGMMCLASLIFFAAMVNVNIEPLSADPTTLADDIPVKSSSGLSKGQLQTILSSIEELSDLVRESTASIHQNLDGITCTFGRNAQTVDNAVVAAYTIGTLAAVLWAISLGVLTDGLYQISKTLRNRFWGWGLCGANLGLAYVLAKPLPDNWLSYFSWTFSGMYIGFLGGLVSDWKTFLQDEDPKRMD